MKKNKAKVIVTYRVLQHWRIPVFKELSGRFDLLVLHSSGCSGTKLINSKDASGVNHKVLKTISFKIKVSGRIAVVLFCPFLVYNLIKKKPDVILAEGGSNFFNNIFVFLYGLFFKVPIVWWTLGEIPGRKYSHLGTLYRKMIVLMEKKSAALIGYSTVAMHYFDRMGYPKQKCFKAVNCVDTDKIINKKVSITKKDALLKDLSLRDSNKIVLFVGALIPEKRIDRLLRAFSSTVGKCEEARLIIIGDGPQRDALRALSDNLNLSKKVFFMGKIIDEVSSYFSLADVFVLPGLGGLAISEALAHGLPVICTIGDGCEVDLVINGETGFRIQGKSEEDYVSGISNAIQKLLNEPVLREGMSRNARKIIEEKYNIGNYVERVAEAIEYASE